MSSAIAFVNPASEVDLEEVEIALEELSVACLFMPHKGAKVVPTTVRKVAHGDLGGDVLVVINGVNGSLEEYGRIRREHTAALDFAKILGQGTRISVNIVLSIPSHYAEVYITGDHDDMSMDSAYERATARVLAHRAKKTEEVVVSGSLAEM